ncbi:MAG: superfamily II DNA/RNA helicase [Saprospiraceae bacterium]|jgi:superfamily II DNA/RNA helicase
MTFKELGLEDQILEAIGYMGFETATPVQEQAMPYIMEGRDILACAQTGTGKTAAFILPILNNLAKNPVDYIDTVVVAPTRELAQQIDKEIQAFSYFAGAESFAVYGGGGAEDFEKQKRALTKGANIIVATPGKLISHLNMGYVKFEKVNHFILDEADRMLDMGFFDDIMKIASYIPKGRQTLLFSATMPPKIRKLAKEILKPNPAEVSISISKPAAGVLQAAYLAYDSQKAQLIRGLIKDKPSYTSILVFTSTKRKVNEIVRALNRSDYKVQAVSSDLDQKDREDAVRRFRSGETRVIVATDVLSRGIDIKGINLVINYDVPNDAEDYVHRIGRTARADSTGVAITVISPDDMYKFAKIEQLIEREVPKIPLPKHLGEGPKWSTERTYGIKGGGNRSGGGRSGSRHKGGGKRHGSRNQSSGDRNQGPRNNRKGSS